MTYQNEKGYLDYDQLFNRLIKRDIRPVAMLSGGPAYLSHLYPQQPVSREGLLENWENYVRAAVQQFGKQVDYWQVGGILNNPQYWGKLMFPPQWIPKQTPTPNCTLNAEKRLQHHQVSQCQRYGHIRRPGPGRRLHQHPLFYLQTLNDLDAWYAFDTVSLNLPTLQDAPETAAIEACGFAPLQSSGLSLVDPLRAIHDFIDETDRRACGLITFLFQAIYWLPNPRTRYAARSGRIRLPNARQRPAAGIRTGR